MAQPSEMAAHGHDCEKVTVGAGGLYECLTDAGRGLMISSVAFGVDPTPQDLENAKQFREATLRTLQSLRTEKDAVAAGYTIDEVDLWRKGGEGKAIDEEVKNGYADHRCSPAALADDALADPTRPECVIYFVKGKTARLIGAMYVAANGTHIPQVAGPIYVPHLHLYHPTCFSDTGEITSIGTGMKLSQQNFEAHATEGCPPGSRRRVRSPEMMHVWSFESSGGTLTDLMSPNADDVSDISEAVGSHL